MAYCYVCTDNIDPLQQNDTDILFFVHTFIHLFSDFCFRKDF